MVWILQLVSEYKTMRADGDLRVVLRWLGGLGDKRAQRANTREFKYGEAYR